jgi:SH3 domain protein
VAGALVALALAPVAARGEPAWVVDQVRINVRTGPGTEYRILGMLETGDSVDVVGRTDGWIQVEAEKPGNGWVPDGFLQFEPPARLALAKSEEATGELRERVSRLETLESELRSENQEIAARDQAQREEIARLTRENLELRAGARWPEWITGGCLVVAGMALGAILQRSSRRAKPRLKL